MPLHTVRGQAGATGRGSLLPRPRRETTPDRNALVRQERAKGTVACDTDREAAARAGSVSNSTPTARASDAESPARALAGALHPAAARGRHLGVQPPKAAVRRRPARAG